MHLSGKTPNGPADDIYLIANSHNEAHEFELPRLDGRQWSRFVDTWLQGDEAIKEPGFMPQLNNQHSYRVNGRSVVVLVAVKSTP